MSELYDDRQFYPWDYEGHLGIKVTEMIVEIPDNIELGDN